MRAQVRGLALSMAVAVTLAPPAARCQEATARPPVMVHLADGSSVPLRGWSLSYEIGSWRQGSSPAFASFSRIEATDLMLGKKSYPTAGATLEIGYEIVEREAEGEGGGEPTKIKVPVPRTLTLVGADGKKTSLKPEPPARDLLMPGADRSLLVQARSLDLRGQTLTGTKSQLCLLTFTTLVECNPLGQQVVKIEFPK